MAIYLTTLGSPTGEFSPTILQIDDATGAKVELLDPIQQLTFEVKDKQLTINVPDDLPQDFAHSFKLTGFQITLTPTAQKQRAAALEALNSSDIDPGKSGENTRFGQ